MSALRDLFALNKQCVAQVRASRRTTYEFLADRFDHSSKIATLVQMLQTKWKLPPREVAKIAVAAAYVLVGDPLVFDQIVCAIRDRADPSAAWRRERERG
jgi:hypothetical protein